jgi:hypothetical protein
MTRLNVLAFALLGACGGIDAQEATPDAVLAPAFDSGVDSGADAWWTADLGQGLCGTGYTQRLYAPNDVVWCEGPTDGVGACGDLPMVGWYKAGLFKCQKVTP